MGLFVSTPEPHRVGRTPSFKIKKRPSAHLKVLNSNSYRIKKRIILPVLHISKMSSPLPIVLCALDAGIGKPASELLLPEFEG